MHELVEYCQPSECSCLFQLAPAAYSVIQSHVQSSSAGELSSSAEPMYTRYVLGLSAYQWAAPISRSWEPEGWVELLQQPARQWVSDVARRSMRLQCSLFRMAKGRYSKRRQRIYHTLPARQYLKTSTLKFLGELLRQEGLLGHSASEGCVQPHVMPKARWGEA